MRVSLVVSPARRYASLCCRGHDLAEVPAQWLIVHEPVTRNRAGPGVSDPPLERFRLDNELCASYDLPLHQELGTSLAPALMCANASVSYAHGAPELPPATPRGLVREVRLRPHGEVEAAKTVCRLPASGLRSSQGQGEVTKVDLRVTKAVSQTVARTPTVTTFLPHTPQSVFLDI